MDHVVIASDDVDRTVGALTAVGMRLRLERRRETSRGTLRQAFFRHGEAVVEVVGPPAGQGPARPDQPAGAHLWGLTVTVSDLDACARQLGALLTASRPAVQPGRHIASVTRAAGLSTRLALMSPDL